MADRPPSNDTPNDNQVLKAVLGAFGTLTAITAAIYVFGGFVLYERLGLRHLHTDVVVSSLPREFLISVGLAVLAQFLLYLLVLLVAYVQEAKLPLEENSGLARVVRSLIVIAATAVLAVPLYRWVRYEDLAWWRLTLRLFFELFLAVLTAGALWFLLKRIVDAPPVPTFDLPTLKSAGLLTLFAFLIFFPWRVWLEAASIDSYRARVCTTNPSHEIKGLFIGANDERVYVGETVFPHRIAEIPRTEIQRLYVGRNAEITPCPASLDSLILPTKAQGGSSTMGAVALKGTAPDEGVKITLSSSSDLATLSPSTVTIPVDESSAFFKLTTSARTMTTVVVSATSDGMTKTASVTVNP